MNSREKGARLEREAAKAITQLLGINAQRAARNGVKGAGDILTSCGVHFEIKGRKQISAARFLDQAHRDAADADRIPVVVMRENNGEWLVLLELGTVREFARRISGAQEATNP